MGAFDVYISVVAECLREDLYMPSIEKGSNRPNMVQWTKKVQGRIVEPRNLTETAVPCISCL